MPPLTHHEILGLVGPFARRGRHVDLAASDRMARRLVFRDVAHDAAVESLQLDIAMPGLHRLTRTLTLADGVQSVLVAEGPEPDALLASVEGIAHARQLRAHPGFTVALSHRLLGRDTLRLTHGKARVAGVTVELAMETDGGRHADVSLTTSLDDPLVLPDDLLAVLGWDWSRLDPRTDRSMRRWSASVRLRGSGRARDDDAEGRLARAAAHVATTLAEPPPSFHDRWQAARWRFAFRRAIPLSVCGLLIVGALLFTKAGLSQDSVVRMLIFNAPPLMLVAFFCLREPPRIEWPARPRRTTAVSWRAVGAAG
jgi:hypothetical protein